MRGTYALMIAGFAAGVAMCEPGYASSSMDAGAGNVIGRDVQPLTARDSVVERDDIPPRSVRFRKRKGGSFINGEFIWEGGYSIDLIGHAAGPPVDNVLRFNNVKFACGDVLSWEEKRNQAVNLEWSRPDVKSCRSDLTNLRTHGFVTVSASLHGKMISTRSLRGAKPITLPAEFLIYSSTPSPHGLPRAYRFIGMKIVDGVEKLMVVDARRLKDDD